MFNVVEFDEDTIRCIRIDFEKHFNCYPKSLEKSLMSALDKANRDPAIRAIVVLLNHPALAMEENYLQELQERMQVDTLDSWIDDVTDLYVGTLKLSKPTVAALSGLALGMSFQFSTLLDSSVIAVDGAFCMPGLKNGIGSYFGAKLFSKVLPLSVMREVIYHCREIPAEHARQLGLVHMVAGKGALLESAFRIAHDLAAAPPDIFRRTKSLINGELVRELETSKALARCVHLPVNEESHSSQALLALLRADGKCISSKFAAL